jgi:hypothetical protein
MWQELQRLLLCNAKSKQTLGQPIGVAPVVAECSNAGGTKWSQQIDCMIDSVDWSQFIEEDARLTCRSEALMFSMRASRGLSSNCQYHR